MPLASSITTSHENNVITRVNLKAKERRYMRQQKVAQKSPKKKKEKEKRLVSSKVPNYLANVFSNRYMFSDKDFDHLPNNSVHKSVIELMV